MGLHGRLAKGLDAQIQQPLINSSLHSSGSVATLKRDNISGGATLKRGKTEGAVVRSARLNGNRASSSAAQTDNYTQNHTAFSVALNRTSNTSAYAVRCFGAQSVVGG